VDADDVFRRLFHQRRYLVVVAVLLAVAAFALADRQTHRTYMANARLVLGPELSSVQEAQTVVSRANSIATTTTVLSTAIKQANVARTPDEVRSEVAVSGIGDSGLAKLTVTDRDPAVATALCRALAAATVSFINQTNDASTQSTLTSIQTQLNQELTKYQEVRPDTNSEAGAAELATISADISALSAARGQLLARQAQQVPASVVDQPGTADPVSRNRLTVGALVAVGGLLFWLLATLVVEAIRPTFPTLQSVARSLDSTVLGQIRADVSLTDPQTSTTLSRLMLAAQHFNADTIVIGTTVGDIEFPQRLQDALQSRTGVSDMGLVGKSRAATRELIVTARDSRSRPVTTRALADPAVSASKNGVVDRRVRAPRTVLRLDDAVQAPAVGTGIVVVARPGVARSALNGVEDLTRCTDWPILGIVEVLPVSKEHGGRDE